MSIESPTAQLNSKREFSTENYLDNNKTGRTLVTSANVLDIFPLTNISSLVLSRCLRERDICIYIYIYALKYDNNGNQRDYFSQPKFPFFLTLMKRRQYNTLWLIQQNRAKN